MVKKRAERNGTRALHSRTTVLETRILYVGRLTTLADLFFCSIRTWTMRRKMSILGSEARISDEHGETRVMISLYHIYFSELKSTSESSSSSQYSPANKTHHEADYNIRYPLKIRQQMQIVPKRRTDVHPPFPKSHDDYASNSRSLTTSSSHMVSSSQRLLEFPLACIGSKASSSSSSISSSLSSCAVCVLA